MYGKSVKKPRYWVIALVFGIVFLRYGIPLGVDFVGAIFENFGLLFGGFKGLATSTESCSQSSGLRSVHLTFDEAFKLLIVILTFISFCIAVVAKLITDKSKDK